MVLTLTFLGGTGTVTGSKYLLDDGQHRLLIDCGLFQGFKALRLRNWAPPPVAPNSISAVVLTHAHLDHSGYLPLLVKKGFRGPVHCTHATAALCEILLPDSGHLQEQDAEFANRHHFSKHNPALPLYSEDDARNSLDRLKPDNFDNRIELPGGATLLFHRAGHILGAASVEILWYGLTIVFTGDIGRYNDPLMPDPVTPPKADYLLMESTYGDRSHEDNDPEDILAGIINSTTHKGGTVVIPAFAVGRAQSLLFHIARLKNRRRLNGLLPVFLDSPMAIDATDTFRRFKLDHKLDDKQLGMLDGDIHYVRTSAESKALTANPMPKVIISASGMATGGRILHHLEHYGPDPKNAIVFAGFQAGGTRGAALVGGADRIKMHGHYVSVRAKVHNLSMLSAHADRDELLRWANGIGQPPRATFVVHGEPQASDALRHRLEEELSWNCIVPDHGQCVSLV